MILSAYAPQLGDRVVVYLDHLGRIEGLVAELLESAFIMSVVGTTRRREKLVERVAWASENADYADVAGRRHVRLEPQNRNSEIRLPDGRAYPVEIMDISLSGAAVSCSVRPALGVRVALSGMGGTVVRHFEAGFAIEFEAGKSGQIHALGDGEREVTN